VHAYKETIKDPGKNKPSESITDARHSHRSKKRGCCYQTNYKNFQFNGAENIVGSYLSIGVELILA
jgi:hypothetical protein